MSELVVRPKTVIALTGGIASGKSSVAEVFAENGAVIIDSDLLSREVVRPGSQGLTELVERFGHRILLPSGELDRAALGRIVFGDLIARAEVNRILHPLIRKLAAQLEDEAPEGSLVVHVIPLLVEAHLAEKFDTIVVVDLPEDKQLSRLQARDGLSEAQAIERIRAQASRAERLAVADYVIDNSSSWEVTKRRAETLFHELRPALSR